MRVVKVVGKICLEGQLQTEVSESPVIVVLSLPNDSLQNGAEEMTY